MSHATSAGGTTGCDVEIQEAIFTGTIRSVANVPTGEPHTRTRCFLWATMSLR